MGEVPSGPADSITPADALPAPDLRGHQELVEVEERQAQLFSRRHIAGFAVAVALVIAAVYVLFPKIVGLDGTLDMVDEAKPLWIVIALGFNVAAFVAYVALFRGVIGDERSIRLDWRASYQITMAGLAATRLFSAGGAGGIALTYWALRKAGMERARTACRMVAFLVLLYAVYMVSLVVFGVLLRTGVLPGQNPAGLTIVPAALAGGVIVIFGLVALIPGDLERRLGAWGQGYRRSDRLARRLATVPATLATGTRTAIAFVRDPSRGGLAVAGAVGFWGANIGILWASFHAFDVEVPLAVVVQGFFVGMAANLLPFFPGGVGSVDAGMISTFVLFGLPGVSDSSIFVAVLTYRLIAFWLPIPPGVIAYFQLRGTVARWDEGRPSSLPGRVVPGPDPALTSKSKV